MTQSKNSSIWTKNFPSIPEETIFCFGMIHGSFNAVKKVAIIDVFVSSHE